MGEKMGQYIFDESNRLRHQWCGNYYIPCLTLAESEDYQIGEYKRMYRSFFQEHHPVLYLALVARETFWKTLADVDRAYREHMGIMFQAMKRQEDVAKDLKVADQLKWVRRMNGIGNRVKETVLRERAYAV